MRFRRRLSTDSQVNMVPMIDVVFQLIIYFMVATTFVITPAISLQLPSSATAEPTAVSRLVITVLSREEIYLNKERYTMDTLGERLAGLSEPEKAQVKSVVLDGDRSISYSLLVEVLDSLRQNGFKAIALRMRTP